MNNALLEQLLKDGFELWRTAANNVTLLEMQPDIARLDVCKMLVDQLLVIMENARTEFEKGPHNTRTAMQQVGMMCTLSVFANDLGIRYARAAKNTSQADWALLYGKKANC